MSNSEEHEKNKEAARLPEDLTLNCLARLSRSDHAALAVASKSYRSLVASSDLYKMRSLMGFSETYVYVCLRIPPDTNPRWFILRRREGSASLIPVPSLPSQAPEASAVVVLDWGIYVIGGFKEGNRSSDVFLFDCRTHTWRQLPSMGLPRAFAAAGVVDGKIYVLGGINDSSHPYWGEVFDPNTQTWDCLPPMTECKIGNKNIHCSFVSDQKIYAMDDTNRTFYYSPRERKWGIGNRGQSKGNRRDWCMINNLIYSICSFGKIYGCESHELDRHDEQDEVIMDSKEVKGLRYPNMRLIRSRIVHFGEYLLNMWEQTKIVDGLTHEKIRKLCGVKGNLEDLLPGARLSKCGDNILLFWDLIKRDRLGRGRLEIWCSEISLDRRQGGEIWGNTVWSNVVMTVDPFVDRYKVLYSVSVTL